MDNYFIVNRHRVFIEIPLVVEKQCTRAVSNQKILEMISYGGVKFSLQNLDERNHNNKSKITFPFFAVFNMPDFDLEIFVCYSGTETLVK